MSTLPSLGLYLHIPFCVKKCDYCDFYSVTDAALMDAYTDALVREIRLYGEKAAGYVTDTVYLGGGTPSYLGEARLCRILRAVREHFFPCGKRRNHDRMQPGEHRPAAFRGAAFLRRESALLRRAGRPRR